MKIVLVLIAILAIGALVIGGLAHRYKVPEQRADFFANRITKKLNLNDEQKAKLDMLKNEMLAARQTMQGKREDSRKAVGELLNNATLDQDKALSLINTHVDSLQAQAPGVIASLGGFWDSLSPEQQAKIRGKIEKHFERRGCCRHGNRHVM